jgi:hypothetical protein
MHTGEGLGTSPAGAKVHVTGISLIRVENGKFEEAWQNWDMLGLMERIKGQAESGVMPPNYVTGNL